MHQNIEAFILKSEKNEVLRDKLLFELATAQAELIPAYKKLWSKRTCVAGGTLPPAVPTEAFRHLRLATFPPDKTIQTFLTSGTTSGARGKHEFRSMQRYDVAALTFGRKMLLQDRFDWTLVSFIPHPSLLKESSLSYMTGLIAKQINASHFFVGGQFQFDANSVLNVLESLRGKKILIMSTSFMLVEIMDALDECCFHFSTDSLLMQTGGFKGRVKEISRADLDARVHGMFGIPPERSIAEYGMTELSSQLYENIGPQKVLHAPPWVRVLVVDPISLEPLPLGVRGLVRIDDLANVDSIACIQTQDEGTRTEQGLILHGRAPDAMPRGCSLAVEEMR